MSLLRLRSGVALSIPASIGNPVVGTSLASVYALRLSGTGPRSAYSNGVWSGSVDAYLSGLGFSLDNTGSLYIDVGTGSKTVANYDFRTAPDFHYDGTSGSLTLNDCALPEGTSASSTFMPVTGVNGTLKTNGTIVVTCNYCLLNKTTFYLGSGTMTYNYCRFSNQIQGLGDTSTGLCILTYDHCYISGGGCNPPAGAHVELTQYNANSSSTFTVSNCMIDVSADGQATLSPTSPNYAWTGVWSVGGVNSNASMSNTIMIGITEVDANPSNTDRIGAGWTYSDSLTHSITNCVLEAGVFGYTHNGSSGSGRPTDGGGNRSFTNAALTASDFG